MDIIGVLLVLLALTLGAVGVAVVIHELVRPTDDRQRFRQRTRRAEQEIIDMGQWEQEAILAALRRRTGGRSDSGASAGYPVVIDGEVIDRGDN